MKVSNLMAMALAACLVTPQVVAMDGPGGSFGAVSNDICTSALATVKAEEGAIRGLNPEITNEEFLALLERTPKAKSFDLSGCHRLTNVVVFKIAETHSDIEAIDLSELGVGTGQFDDEAVFALTRSCNLIKRINISSGKFTNAAVQAIAMAYPELVAISLGDSQITDDAIIHLFDSCKVISELDLCGCNGLTSAAFEAIAEKSNGFTSFHVGSGKGLLDEHLIAISEKSHQLTRVSLFGCDSLTPKSIDVFTKNCPEVIWLNMSNNGKLHTKGFEWVAKNLRNLTWVSFAEGRGVSDVVLETLAKNNKKLQVIDLSNCVKIADGGVVALAKSCPLASISLVDCRNVTAKSTSAIAGLGPMVAHLDISGCEKITTAGLLEVAQGCTQLISLRMGKCRVTDDVVRAVLANCPLLQVLGLYDSKLALTVFDGQEVHPNLKELHLINTPKFTGEAWDGLKKIFPNATVNIDN